MQRVKTSENFAEEKKRLQKMSLFFQEISQKIEDITLTGFQRISGYLLETLCGRMLSPE